jgi:ABC-type lipoprotein export system ATPase subunit
MYQLRLDNVSKVYQLKEREVLAVNEVSFCAKAGMLTTLEGPSGSGKTTLLSLIGGLDYPTQGEIHYDDRNIASSSLAELAKIRRQKVAFVFQDYLLFNELTVLDNVALSLQIAHGGNSGIEPRARRWIRKVGLEHRLDHRPYQLSGGEKQRVGVARALVKQPELLIADEPTSNLDDENRQTIFNLLTEYIEQTEAILLVATHDPVFLQNSQSRLKVKGGRLQIDAEGEPSTNLEAKG